MLGEYFELTSCFGDLFGVRGVRFALSAAAYAFRFRFRLDLRFLLLYLRIDENVRLERGAFALRTLDFRLLFGLDRKSVV